MKQKLSTRDLPLLPERDARSVSPADPPPAASIRKAKHSPQQRHSMQIGAQLPLPHSVALPQEGDTAQIHPASESDEEEEERPAAEVSDEMVKIKLPSGDYHVVARPRRSSQEHPGIQYEDDDKMYMVPFEAKDSLKPDPTMLVNLKTAPLPRSASLQNQQQFSQIVDSDYAEPINSLRMSPRVGRKLKVGDPVPPSNPLSKGGSVENLYAPVIKSSKTSLEDSTHLPPASAAADSESADVMYTPVVRQPKKVGPAPPVRKASLERGQELMYAIPDKPKPKGPPPKPPTRTASLEKDQEMLYAVPDKQKPKTVPKPPVRKASLSGEGEKENEVVYAIPDRSKPKNVPPPILHEKPKFGAAQKTPPCEFCWKWGEGFGYV